MSLYIYSIDNRIFISSVNPDTEDWPKIEDNSFEVKWEKRFTLEQQKNIIRNVLGDGLNSNSQIVVC